MPVKIKTRRPAPRGDTSTELTGVFQETLCTRNGSWMLGMVSVPSTLNGQHCMAPEKIQGEAVPGSLQPGCAYRFFGKWADHPRHGRSFKFTDFVADTSHSREAVVQYLLSQFKKWKLGLGKSKCESLYDLWGSDTVRKMRANPAEVAAHCKVSIDNASQAAKILDRDTKLQDAKIELIGMFAGTGFPKKIVGKLVDKWGAKAVAFIKRDPFLLLTHKFPGAGFPRVDNLYLSLGGDPARLKRQTLCAWHGMREASRSSGHTWHLRAVAVTAMRQKISGADVRADAAIQLGIRAEWLAKKNVRGVTYLADHRNAKNEQTIANIVRRMMGEPAEWPEIDAADLSEHQRTELAKAMAGRIGILAGSPGTGKTYSAAAVVRAIIAKHGEGVIGACAPTGKAAVRMEESFANCGIDLEVSTTHRLLGPRENGHGTGEWGFEYNASNRLPYKFILVDETSMKDTDIMAALLSAIRPDCHVLLIGDTNQLAPVGHGAPLRDLIAAGLPCGELTEIRRNAGMIVRACAAIRDGGRPEFCERFTSDDSQQNLMLVKVRSEANVQSELRAIVSAVVRDKRRDPVQDVQVLVALNRTRESLNAMLQSIINPPGPRGHGERDKAETEAKYRIGDKVICLSNGGYPGMPDPENPEAEPPKHLVFNGEQGLVQDVDMIDRVVVMAFPDTGPDQDRILRIPIKSEYFEKFDLAYAITVHKSQGSEWPVVVVVTEDRADRIASREWHYTAYSRASQRCIVLGTPSTIGRQCRRVTIGERKTFLRELIEEQ